VEEETKVEEPKKKIIKYNKVVKHHVNEIASYL